MQTQLLFRSLFQKKIIHLHFPKVFVTKKPQCKRNLPNQTQETEMGVPSLLYDTYLCLFPMMMQA